MSICIYYCLKGTVGGPLSLNIYVSIYRIWGGGVYMYQYRSCRDGYMYSLHRNVRTALPVFFLFSFPSLPCVFFFANLLLLLLLFFFLVFTSFSFYFFFFFFLSSSSFFFDCFTLGENVSEPRVWKTMGTAPLLSPRYL